MYPRSGNTARLPMLNIPVETFTPPYRRKGGGLVRFETSFCTSICLVVAVADLALKAQVVIPLRNGIPLVVLLFTPAKTYFHLHTAIRINVDFQWHKGVALLFHEAY